LSRFILSTTERAILKIAKNKEASRLQRWEKIAQEACRQCGQPFVPEIDHSNSLSDALALSRGDLKLMLWEDASTPLQELIPPVPPQRISLLVGPEGGFTADEAGRAQAAGFSPVRLGPRILRTETAGLAILSILQYLYGDLDRNVSSFSSPKNGKDMS
jgi:16S rRNA (uracil1498-N3)-methyltransferase